MSKSNTLAGFLIFQIVLSVWNNAHCAEPASQSAPFWKSETMRLTESDPAITIQLNYVPGSVKKHPVILMLGSLKTNELPFWSTNLVREGYMLAAWSSAYL